MLFFFSIESATNSVMCKFAWKPLQVSPNVHWATFFPHASEALLLVLVRKHVVERSALSMMYGT